MMQYKNMSLQTKTFYGVQFKPGAVNTVPRCINDPAFVLVTTSKSPNLKKSKQHSKPEPSVQQAVKNNETELEKGE